MKNENQTVKSFSTDDLKELEILVFQMTEIYQRLQYDRDRWSVIGVTLSKAVETFKEQNQEYRDLITQNSEHQLNTLHQTTIVLDDLKMNFQHSKYQQDRIKHIKLISLFAFVGAVLGSLVSGLIWFLQ